jgi:hypothetical protein
MAYLRSEFAYPPYHCLSPPYTTATEDCINEESGRQATPLLVQYSPSLYSTSSIDEFSMEL